MDRKPGSELPPESFGERGGTATKEEPTVDQETCDPQPGLGKNTPVEEEKGERKNEGVGTAE